MASRLAWQYDEFAQVGKDYGKAEEVAQYEARHSDFRDLERESDEVLERLCVESGHILVDLGCGTGIFAIQAAKKGATVHAVDVSRPMLEFAEGKAREAGASSISFHHGGFLTYEHTGPAADFVTSTFVLHHLPDFWKRVALERIYEMLRPGGTFYLYDVILDPVSAMENVDALIDRLAQKGGDFMRQDAEDHFRLEFSTFDWIIDGLLGRCGFCVQKKEMQDGVIGIYHCTRPD